MRLFRVRGPMACPLRRFLRLRAHGFLRGAQLAHSRLWAGNGDWHSLRKATRTR